MVQQGYVTPIKNFMPGNTSPALQQILINNQNKRKARTSLIWGSVNVGLLSVVLYDLTNSCPFDTTYIIYTEYVASIILFLNLIYHFYQYFTVSWKTERISIPSSQKKLLGIKKDDPNYQVQSTSPPFTMSTPITSPSTTSVASSTLSWRTNTSCNESLNYSTSSPSWTYINGCPDSPRNDYQPALISSPFHNSSNGNITNEDSLNKYLKNYETFEKSMNVDTTTEQSNNLLSSFWTHSANKRSNEISPFLRKCQYQLASQLPVTDAPFAPIPSLSCSKFPNYYYGDYPRPYVFYAVLSTSANSSGSSDDKSTPMKNQVHSMEMWRKLNVDGIALTQWNANLRMWISQTILERLVKEFNNLDEAFQKHGLADIHIGRVGLDRLRKTSQMAPVLQFMPSLPAIIPFLELTSNQEYLVKRIHELTRGGCMSEFKWNGGSSFNGKEWDASLPTDSVIIMHLFASYLDTQLMPLPNKPDVKPFSGYHFIKCSDPMPKLTMNTLAIHQVSELPPHYHVIIGEEIFEMVKGHNNLFHSILLFLYHVNKKEHGMLGFVNLGRAGVNMLWIIQS